MSAWIAITVGAIIGGGLGKFLYFPSPNRQPIIRRGASKKSDNAGGMVTMLLLCVAFLALCVGALAMARDANWTAILAFLLAALIPTWLDKKAANARRLELTKAANARRLELEEQQRRADFDAEGARLYEQAAASVAQIAGSEAARAGWLGDPSDFDFRSDLAAMAANLRRAEEIRKVREEGASITHLTAADKKMLDDAQRAIAALKNAAKERSRLIEECARQAADIDTQLADDRERGVSAKRREDLRNRLGPMLYGTQNMPAEIPSESADVVKARAAAFRELRDVLRNYRLDGDGV
jgi:hypothetical protein